MKKAKLMLSAIAVLAVVGGAFAFKANRAAGNVYCPTTSAAGALCATTAYRTNVPGNLTTARPCVATGISATYFYTTANCAAQPTFTSQVYLTANL